MSEGAVVAADAPVPAGRHERLLEELGAAICSGRFGPGHVITIDQVAEEHGVSRSVVREVLRVLASMGLLDTRRKIGTIIRPAREWNVFDPQVIRWRLAGNDRIAQVQSLIEVRTAVEPVAAALAASRAEDRAAMELVGLAAQLWSAGEGGSPEEFVRLDIEFHQSVLRLSGNEMFVAMQDLVAEVLTGRHQYGLIHRYPPAEVLRHHADVAQAIQRRDGDAAKQAMICVMDVALAESISLWESPDSVDEAS